MTPWRGRRRHRFLERTLDGLREAMEHAVSAETTAAHTGLLQRLDPRVKLVGLLSLVAAAALARRLAPIAALIVLAVLLALASRLSLRRMARVWLGVFLFTAAIAVPALVITPGRAVLRLPLVEWPVTAQGLTTAGYLLLRVEAAATLGFLLVFTTGWPRVLKALRAFRVPVVFVVILGMTSRYILLLLQAAHDLFEARRSRTAGRLDARDRRRLAAEGAGVLMGKALDLSGEVFLAMQARGFRGEVRLLDDFRMRTPDWIALASLTGAAALVVWAAR